MIFRLSEGPMNGAVYCLDKHQPNTNRKPDGLWFDGWDDIGVPLRHQYREVAVNAVREEDGDGVELLYSYEGTDADWELLRQRAETRTLDKLAEARKLPSALDSISYPVEMENETEDSFTIRDAGGDILCECQDGQDARLIVAALNFYGDREAIKAGDAFVTDRGDIHLKRRLSEAGEAVAKLKGVANVLADKLSRFTGRTVPDELQQATEQVEKGEDHAPTICVKCGDESGPIAKIDAEHPGWLCPACLRELHGGPLPESLEGFGWFAQELPDFLATRVERWLKSNGKKASQVRHGLFPLGMVNRWVERAEAAEEKQSYDDLAASGGIVDAP